MAFASITEKSSLFLRGDGVEVRKNPAFRVMRCYLRPNARSGLHGRRAPALAGIHHGDSRPLARPWAIEPSVVLSAAHRATGKLALRRRAARYRARYWRAWR